MKRTSFGGAWRAALLGGLAVLIGAPEASAGQGPQPGICSRVCWNARAGSATEMSALTRAVIHHTAGSGDYNVSSIEDSKAKVRAIQNLHIDDRGWADIGYHFLVDKLGNIFEGRVRSINQSYRPRGAHDANNTNSFGFNVMGYYHPPYNQAFTAASRNALWDVIAWRMPSDWSPYGSGSYSGKTVGYLAGHRDVKSTDCPGNGVYATIGTNYFGGEARDAVNIRKSGAPPPPPATVYGIERYLRNSNSTGPTDIRYDYGMDTDYPIAGDWNGNGVVTPGVIRGRTWYLKNANASGAADIVFDFGDPGDTFIVGDWDGNGTHTPGVFRNGIWYLRNSNTSGQAHFSFQYGDSTDTHPIVGDWDGNGTWTPGLIRGINWLLRNSNTAGVANISFLYGDIGDKFLAGDWDGNGTFTPGVVRGYTWYLRNANSGGVANISFGYGNTTDFFIVGDWDGNGTWTPGVVRP